ncbi:hypothetical protein L9F63_020219, partial [Diploptera punctata]
DTAGVGDDGFFPRTCANQGKKFAQFTSATVFDLMMDENSHGENTDFINSKMRWFLYEMNSLSPLQMISLT